MTLPDRANLCPYCGCIFSVKEKERLTNEALASKNAAQRLAREKTEKEKKLGERDGSQAGFWFMLLGGMSFGFFWLILIITWLVSVMSQTPRSEGFHQGVIKGALKAFMLSIAIFIVFVFCFKFLYPG
jgi:hypothetical protein